MQARTKIKNAAAYYKTTHCANRTVSKCSTVLVTTSIWHVGESYKRRTRRDIYGTHNEQPNRDLRLSVISRSKTTNIFTRLQNEMSIHDETGFGRVGKE